MTPIQCKCTECGQLFVITTESCKIDSMTMKDGEELELEYFSCPACKKVFPVYLENSYVRQLKRERVSVQKKIDKLIVNNTVQPGKYTERFNRYTKRVTKLLTEINKTQKMLKDKYQGEFYLLDSTNK